VLLGGDVMLGRGVDQILPHPGDPVLHEPWVADARRYVEIAEQSNGPIPRPVAPDWPWGEALAVVDRLAPVVRLVNLETTITADGAFAPGKGIHYRMHPGNIAALTTFAPDVCALANNHILDFGRRGLCDTLDALTAAGIHAAGAGTTIDTACRPVLVRAGAARTVAVASVAAKSSGTPGAWAPHLDRPGVWLIETPFARRAADHVAAKVLARKGAGDLAVVSVHWGPNWGYELAPSEIRFAHRLVDAGVDIVHGHSSHHPRPIEIYRGKPILYGCGDVIDDYEGIAGHEAYRPELRLLYLTTFDPGGRLVALRLLPLRVRRMRLERAAPADTGWLRAMIEHISGRFGTRVSHADDDLLEVVL
jgi:poly-gamma-glutamate synthesis protein (capsule biosynthesis protein)